MMHENRLYEGIYDSRKLDGLNKRVFDILGNRSPIDDYIREICEELLEESHYYIEGKFGYRVLNEYDISVKRDCIELSGKIILNSSRIIASQLKDSEGLTVFASTLGNKFDAWLKKLFASNDPLKGYIADLIGSVAVECAADNLEEMVIEYFSKYSISCSNRYSPGYCNWNVVEQKKLFSLLPDNFCGITLTPSSLMIPIKSVSGIIGYGKNLEKRDYACKICTQENCYMNKLKAD